MGSVVATREYAKGLFDSLSGITGEELKPGEDDKSKLAKAVRELKEDVQALKGAKVVGDASGNLKVGNDLDVGNDASVKGTLTIPIDKEDTDVGAAISALRKSSSGSATLTGGTLIEVKDGVINWSGKIAGEVKQDSTDFVTSGLVHSALKSVGELKVATKTELGGVKVGSGLSVAADGTLNADATAAGLTSVKLGESALPVSEGSVSVPYASASAFGVVKVGTGLSVLDGVLSATGERNAIIAIKLGGVNLATGEDRAVNVPVATETTFGVLKVGTGLSVKDGIVSAADTAVKVGSGLVRDEEGNIRVSDDIATKSYVDELFGEANDALDELLGEEASS